VTVLHMTLLGSVAFRLSPGESVPLSRKSGLLLAYLALQPQQRATREQAIALLWSDRADPQARASMRQELLTLRKSLAAIEPSPLHIEGEWLELDRSAIEVDALEMQRLSQSSTPAELDAAIALYRGEFLSGLSPRDPGGEDWVRQERERFRNQYLRAAETRLWQHLQAARWAAATDVARRILEEDPVREDIQRTMIALLALSGQRSLAVRQFETCRQVLRSELDVEPEQRTIRLAQRVRELGDEDKAEELALRLRETAAQHLGARAAAPPEPRPSIPEGQPAIAVLPFASLGADPALEVFGDGLVEGITGALSRVRSFFVIARASTQRYRGEAIDAGTVGTELGVRYLLLGSLQRDGQRIRVNTQLIEAGSGAVLWSDRQDGTLEDVFDLQDQITERTVGAIAPTVRTAEIERAKRKRPDSLAAYDYLMRALPQIWTVTRESNAEALRLTTEAIRLDPGFALAYAYASWSHFWNYVNDWTETGTEPRAEAYRLVQAALRLDSEDPSVLSIAALSATAIENDLDAASQYVEKALAIDPNSAWGYLRRGYIKVYQSQTDDALQDFARTARLSPFDPLTFNRYVGMALAHFASGRYEEAVRCAEQARIERPGLVWAQRVLITSLAALGEVGRARSIVTVMRRETPSLTVARMMTTVPFQRADVRDRFAGGLAAAGLPLGAVPPWAARGPAAAHG
jgi:TolB-like protein